MKKAQPSPNSLERYPPPPALAGQMAVVTGASSGIGKAIALELAAMGARLCLLGRRQASLEEVARAGRMQNLTYEVDLAVPEEIEGFAASFARDCGEIDLLIHSAGVIGLGGIERASVEELDRQFCTNVRAPYVLTQALLPLLRARHGQVVFINSSAGLSANAGSGQYAATKHALTAIADSLRQEVNADGIRVLSVFIGRTATPMQATVHAFEGRPYCPEKLVQPENVASLVIHALSVPRTAEVTAIHMRPFAKTD
ncbi:MAG: SDR family oxidoreductase [Candidatus Binatia bacterium]